ncbi:MAG: hypothetical protein HC794_07855 [Nitrospiraceae bacterium]|nr:hypothetical protein [Nitrospiraceae bacterium]
MVDSHIAYGAPNKQDTSAAHGEPLGEQEVRLTKRNYGWPEVSFSKEYGSGQAISPQTSKPGLVDPLLEWTPALAPSGLTVYRDGQIPSWQGNLFAGGLRAQQVRRITVDGSGRAADVETFAFDQRVRDVRQGPDGLLYVLTDDANGKLIRLEPKLGSPRHTQCHSRARRPPTAHPHQNLHP